MMNGAVGRICFRHLGRIYDFGANAPAPAQEILIEEQDLKNLGCEYIFSRVELTNAQDMQLEYIKEYEDGEMPYSVFLYRLK